MLLHAHAADCSACGETDTSVRDEIAPESCVPISQVASVAVFSEIKVAGVQLGYGSLVFNTLQKYSWVSESATRKSSTPTN